METIGSFLSSLDKKTPLTWVLLVLIIFILVNQNSMSKEISQIDHKLGNHITDTNRKIEKLSDRFDDLYKLLLKDKIENK